MASESTPRINCQYLEQFIGKTVRITGKVVSLRGDTGTLEAKGAVTIHLNRVSKLDISLSQQFVEYVGMQGIIIVRAKSIFGGRCNYERKDEPQPIR